MGLSCYCGDWDGEGVGWYAPDDYTEFKAARRIRCCSCKELIDQGAISAKFQRFRYPQTDIEIKIWGDDAEIGMANWWMCERCADLYYSLDALGFCVSIEDDMRELVKEYAAMQSA